MWSYGGLKSQDVKNVLEIFAFFGKMTHYSKAFFATLIDVLCSNFVKFGRWEIEHCLPDKKFLPGSPAVATAWIAPKICQGQPRQRTQSAPDFIQIGSLSAEL